MTLIDDSWIRSCPQCGAALMPENQVAHSEWHRGVQNRLVELEAYAERVQQWIEKQRWRR